MTICFSSFPWRALTATPGSGGMLGSGTGWFTVTLSSHFWSGSAGYLLCGILEALVTTVIETWFCDESHLSEFRVVFSFPQVDLFALRYCRYIVSLV